MCACVRDRETERPRAAFFTHKQSFWYLEGSLWSLLLLHSCEHGIRNVYYGNNNCNDSFSLYSCEYPYTDLLCYWIIE